MASQSLVSIMMRQLGMTLLVAVSLLLSSRPVHGIGGSVTNGGAFATGTADDTSVREWVTLVGTDGVLSGRPKHPAIALITVYAPGADGDHLILRELAAADGKKSLLLSAPASLVQKARRATLYIKYHDEQAVLFEYEEGRWWPRQPQPMRVVTAEGHGTLQDRLLAFTVAGPGLYRLSGSRAPDESDSVPQEPLASTLVGGGMSRGVLPWVCSVLLLLVGWTLSRVLHKVERGAGN